MNRLVAGGLLGLLILASLPVGAAEPSALDSPIETLNVEAKIPRQAEVLAFGFGSLWTVNGDRLVRVDPADDSFVEIEVPGGSDLVRGIAIGEDAVWVPDIVSDAVHRVDPATNKVVGRIGVQMTSGAGSIGVGEGAVWVVTQDGIHNYLARFDALTGAEEARIPLPGGGDGVVVDYGSVWVTDAGEDKLYRVDPGTNGIVSTISLHDTPRLLASGEGSVWVLEQGDGSVQRVDGRTGEVIATIEVGLPFERGDIATGGGYVWVSMLGIPVVQIDPRTDRLVRRFTGYEMSDSICFGAGSLWVSGEVIHRVRPPR